MLSPAGVLKLKLALKLHCQELALNLSLNLHCRELALTLSLDLRCQELLVGPRDLQHPTDTADHSQDTPRTPHWHARCESQGPVTTLQTPLGHSLGTPRTTHSGARSLRSRDLSRQQRLS